MLRSRKKLTGKKVKRAKNNPRPKFAETQNQEDIFSLYLTSLQSLSRKIKQSKALHVNSGPLKQKVKNIVKSYFEAIRVDLLERELDVAAIDEKMQALLLLANSRSRISAYNEIFCSLDKNFRILESRQLIVQSDRAFHDRNTQNNSAIVGQDKKILDVLSRIMPTIALSYQQIIFDISQPKISYKGTAAEQREVLREVLDYLAPDAEVIKSLGFKLEKDKTTPTMKQKVRFILKNRNKSASAIEVPENAAVIVEESIAKLARATYNRGSLSAHTETEKAEVISLKRYLDSVLCELLEIY